MTTLRLALPATVRGSFAWVAGLFVAAMVTTGLATLALAGTALSTWVVPGAVALVFIAAFLLRPKESVLAFSLFVLFYQTIALWTLPQLERVDELVVPPWFAITFWRTGQYANRRPSFMTWAILAATALALLSTLVNQVSLTSVAAPAFLLFIKGFLFLYTVRWLDYTLEDLRLTVVVIFWVAAVVLVLGFVEFLDPLRFQQVLHLREITQERGGLHSVKSVFHHPVLFAWFTAFVGLYCYAFFSVFRRWWMLGVALLFSVGTILSLRRKAMIGSGVALLFGAVVDLQRTWSLAQLAERWHAFRERVVRVWVPITIGVGVLVIAFFPVFSDLADKTMDRYVSVEGVSLTEPPPGGYPQGYVRFEKGTPPRVALYLVSLEVARDNFPLGAGLGRYGSWMSREVYSPVYFEYGLSTLKGLRPAGPAAITDTFWPSILGELGVIGFIAYVAFIVALVVEVWRVMRRARSPLVRAFAFGTLLVLAEALAESVATPMFAAPSPTYFVLGAIGLLLAIGRHEAEQEAATPMQAPAQQQTSPSA